MDLLVENKEVFFLKLVWVYENEITSDPFKTQKKFKFAIEVSDGQKKSLKSRPKEVSSL